VRETGLAVAQADVTTSTAAKRPVQRRIAATPWCS
jgi:hypothetical protein